MSDIEKIISYYNYKLETLRPIVIRWEGAGDCRHPLKILDELVKKKIPFDAQIHCYEPEGDPQFISAETSLGDLAKSFGEDQRLVLKSSVNVTRTKSTNASAKIVDLMFVRNIMPTGSGDLKVSRVKQSNILRSIHKGAIRNRRNSIVDGGELNIGMSGAPGIIGASAIKRYDSSAKKLFCNYRSLSDTGRSSGYEARTGPAEFPSFDSGSVMKNNGIDIGGALKKTYYLTFYA